MSYSCTSVGNRQDRSSSKQCGGSVHPASVNVTSSSSSRDSSTSPDLVEAMKVKKGCNTADLGVPVTTEEDLLGNTIITPEDVLGLQKITQSK